MTEQTTTATEDERPTVAIDFNGRELYVHMPTPEQILVWRRTLDKLQNVDQIEGWNGHQVMNALERIRLILDSTLANQTDIDWFDDEMLAGRIGLRDMAPIITQTIKAFQDRTDQESNRATRRAAKKAAPATPARRRAPAKKTTPRKATT
jgi:hypothetical protein